MLKAASTYVFVKQRLHPGLLDGLARAGAEAIEIFAARGHFDYTDRIHIREIANWFRTSGTTFSSLHAPLFSDNEWGRGDMPPVNLVDKEKRHRIDSMDEVKRAIEVAEQSPFRFLILHLGNGGEAFDDQKFENAMSSVEHLRAFAKPLGVSVLLENIPNEIATPERLVELVTKAHFSDVGFCFDVGHANVMSSVAEAFAIMKDYIRSTHIHDNAGDRDAHLWPGDGTIDWDEAVALLRTAPRIPPFLTEIEGDGQDPLQISAKMAAAFQKLEAVKATT